MKVVLFVAAFVASTFTASLFGSQSNSNLQNSLSAPNSSAPVQTRVVPPQFVGQARQKPLGIPAIHTHQQMSGAVANPGAPTFTRDDVLNFIMNESPTVYHAITIGKPIISQVDFLTVDQAELKFKLGLQSLPSDQLICVVVFDNQVIFSGGPGVGDITSQGAFEVFDAQTGNFIVSFNKV